MNMFAQNINKFVQLKVDFGFIMIKDLRISKLHTKHFRQNKHKNL